MSELNKIDPFTDGVDRRGFLKCMAWVGTGIIWTVNGGVLSSRAFGAPAADEKGDFSFAQISDSHIGFSRGQQGCGRHFAVGGGPHRRKQYARGPVDSHRRP